MKRIFFGLFLLFFFFRLQIYKAITAIFWRSASYVLRVLIVAVVVFLSLSVTIDRSLVSLMSQEWIHLIVFVHI